jgi:hypothetical protein
MQCETPVSLMSFITQSLIFSHLRNSLCFKAFSEAVPKDLIDAVTEHEGADEEVEDGIRDITDGVERQTSLAPGSRILSSIGRTMRSTSLPRHVVPGISLPANAHDTILFAPKCLVLISKFDYPEVFKNCLGVLYTAYR